MLSLIEKNIYITRQGTPLINVKLSVYRTCDAVKIKKYINYFAFTQLIRRLSERYCRCKAFNAYIRRDIYIYKIH